jgi:hypothetical protein
MYIDGSQCGARMGAPASAIGVIVNHSVSHASRIMHIYRYTKFKNVIRTHALVTLCKLGREERVPM